MARQGAQIPQATQDDWDAIVLREGMNLFATFVYELRQNARRELENPALDTIKDVEHRRGQIVAYTRILNFLRSEHARAAKGESAPSNTPDNKED